MKSSDRFSEDVHFKHSAALAKAFVESGANFHFKVMYKTKRNNF
jgi:hypothetical protein